MGNACTASILNRDKLWNTPYMNECVHCLLCMLKKSTGTGVLTENKDGIKCSVVTLKHLFVLVFSNEVIVNRWPEYWSTGTDKINTQNKNIILLRLDTFFPLFTHTRVWLAGVLVTAHPHLWDVSLIFYFETIQSTFIWWGALCLCQEDKLLLSLWNVTYVINVCWVSPRRGETPLCDRISVV